MDAYVPIAPFPYIPTGTNYELYSQRGEGEDEGSGDWRVVGTTPVQLWDSWLTCGELSQKPKNGPSFELGPGVLRPDGTVFYAGSNPCPGAGHTAIYNSRTNTWEAGSDFPGNINIADGPAALEVDGKVLMMASPGYGNPPVTFFEWDGTALKEVPGTPNAPTDGSFYGNMLALPSGEILLTDFSDDIEIYTAYGRSAARMGAESGLGARAHQGGQNVPNLGFRFNGFAPSAA